MTCFLCQTSSIYTYQISLISSYSSKSSCVAFSLMWAIYTAIHLWGTLYSHQIGEVCLSMQCSYSFVFLGFLAAINLALEYLALNLKTV